MYQFEEAEAYGGQITYYVTREVKLACFPLRLIALISSLKYDHARDQELKLEGDKESRGPWTET